MTSQTIKKVIKRLEDIKKRSTMETADLGKNHELIKEETRLWRATWITAPLDEVIEDLKLLAGD